MNRRQVLGAAVLAPFAPHLALAAPASAPVVTYHAGTAVLDISGRSFAYRPGHARAVSLSDHAYAWRPFL